MYERTLATLALLTLGTGCAGTAPIAKTAEPPALDNEPEQAAATPAPTPSAAPEPAKIPDPPAECRAYVERAPQTFSGEPREKLALSLVEKDGTKRDELLVCLEKDKAFAPGLVRALRADLGPEACADAIVEPMLSADAGIGDDQANVLRGLALAGKLARLATSPPKLEPPLDKPRFLEFFERELKPWVVGQATAIGQLSQESARLSGYGKATAAIAAGTADLRFVDMVREVPLPDEMKNDKEVRDTYYAALDEALEPRKQRGRDAVLVGLRMLSHFGVVSDPRIGKARALLAKLYSGSRVDALDQLLLPSLPAAKPSKPNERLAAGLPSYYAASILADVDPSDPELLRALIERGLPPELRKKLDQQKLQPKVQKLYARALVELGKVYFRAAEFKRVTELLGPKPQDEEAELLFGVSTVLAAGPADITELMFKGAQFSNFGNSAALEGVAKSKRRLAGHAAFNGAYLLELAPRRDDPKFWEGLAERYGSATKLLADPAQKKLAAEYEKAAASTAKTLRSAP